MSSGPTTRCAARRPHVHGARSALGTEGGAQLPKEESNLGKEGPEDKEERDSQAPEGLHLVLFKISVARVRGLTPVAEGWGSSSPE